MGRWKTVIGSKLKVRTFKNQKTEANIGVRVLNCVFRSIRPPIPTTSAHLFRSIRPPVMRCCEAAFFSYQV